jgi:hypothetical protein
MLSFVVEIIFYNSCPDWSSIYDCYIKNFYQLYTDFVTSEYSNIGIVDFSALLNQDMNDGFARIQKSV